MSKCLNENGKDYKLNGTEECFVVDNIFNVANRSLVIGKALQPLKVGDVVWFGKNRYSITNMQVGNSVITCANIGDNCGLMLSDFSKKDLNNGDKLMFKDE